VISIISQNYFLQKIHANNCKLISILYKITPHIMCQFLFPAVLTDCGQL